MKRLILAAVVAAFANSASAQTMWQGDLIITEHVAGAEACEAQRDARFI
jgi:hypothetical protein